MKLPRRNFLHLAVGAAALPARSRFAWAQAYPTRPVHWIVSFAAGGPNDIVAAVRIVRIDQRTRAGGAGFGAPDAEQAFRNIATLTRGAYCRFDRGAARQLAELLRAVAVYAVGGLTALANRSDAGAVKLLSQLR